MRKQERVNTDFISDDGKIGVLIERTDNNAITVTLAIKGISPKYEITAGQLKQLAEVASEASAYLLAQEKPVTLGQIG